MPGHQYNEVVTIEPTTTQKGQAVCTCTICGDTYTKELDWQRPQITGITAENQKTVYDGTAKQIEIAGTQKGDRITYKHEDDIYRLGQPEMKNTGVYQVSYKIKCEGQVTLPQGFTWEDSSVKLSKEGEITIYVSYVPKDTRNYETVSHIPVKVTVTSPNQVSVSSYTFKKLAAATK